MSGMLSGKYFPFVVSALIALLSAADYLLFREYELVWPFFLLPYLVFSILYIILVIRTPHIGFLFHAMVFFVIIPAFAGLAMCIGWMIKIDFIGEMIRTLAG